MDPSRAAAAKTDDDAQIMLLTLSTIYGVSKAQLTAIS